MRSWSPTDEPLLHTEHTCLELTWPQALGKSPFFPPQLLLLLHLGNHIWFDELIPCMLEKGMLISSSVLITAHDVHIQCRLLKKNHVSMDGQRREPLEHWPQSRFSPWHCTPRQCRPVGAAAAACLKGRVLSVCIHRGIKCFHSGAHVIFKGIQ